MYSICKTSQNITRANYSARANCPTFIDTNIAEICKQMLCEICKQMLLLPFTTVVTRKQHCRSTRMQNEKHEYTWPKFQSLSTRTERAERRQKQILCSVGHQNSATPMLKTDYYLILGMVSSCIFTLFGYCTAKLQL